MSCELLEVSRCGNDTRTMRVAWSTVGTSQKEAGRAHCGLGPCTQHECDRAQLWDRSLGWCAGMKVERKVTRLTGGSGGGDVGLG